MVYDPENIFAKILRGEIPCKKVYEDDFALAFHDIYPKAPIHILVTPKGPYVNQVDFDTHASEQEIVGFYKAVALICVEQGLDKTGYRLITNCGVHSGQEVPHYHIHILAGRFLGPMLAS